MRVPCDRLRPLRDEGLAPAKNLAGIGVGNRTWTYCSFQNRNHLAANGRSCAVSEVEEPWRRRRRPMSAAGQLMLYPWLMALPWTYVPRLGRLWRRRTPPQGSIHARSRSRGNPAAQRRRKWPNRAAPTVSGGCAALANARPIPALEPGAEGAPGSCGQVSPKPIPPFLCLRGCLWVLGQANRPLTYRTAALSDNAIFPSQMRQASPAARPSASP